MTRENVMVPFLDDFGPSWFHVLFGAGMRTMSPEAAAASLLFFTLYQMGESEPLADKLGDFAELAVGYLGAAALGAKHAKAL